MASHHLCKPTKPFRGVQLKLPNITASTPHISTPFKLNPTRLYKFARESLPQRHSHLINYTENMTDTTFELLQTTTRVPLKIGIIGLGEFGQFLANAFQRQGHNILATLRSDYSVYCQKNGIQIFRNVNGLSKAQPDIMLVCTSISSTEDIVRGIPFHKMKSNTIIVDVLSVKRFPKNLLLEVVPSGFGILCTHPMFGKFSGKNSWEGLQFVYDKVQIEKNCIQEKICKQFLDIFEDEGCEMIEMSCEKHDEYAAESRFLTHTIARILSNMNLNPTPIDTKGYEALMELTKNTVSHGSDLYDGLFLYNVDSIKQIEKLEKAFERVKQSLYKKLRNRLRREIEETMSINREEVTIQTSKFLPSSEKLLKDLSSFSRVHE